jgi:hypothetical protein
MYHVAPSKLMTNFWAGFMELSVAPLRLGLQKLLVGQMRCVPYSHKLLHFRALSHIKHKIYTLCPYCYAHTAILCLMQTVGLKIVQGQHLAGFCSSVSIQNFQDIISR